MATPDPDNDATGMVIPTEDDQLMLQALRDILLGTNGTVREQACIKRIAARHISAYTAGNRLLIGKLRARIANQYGHHLLDIL